jgi:hypothetical protein
MNNGMGAYDGMRKKQQDCILISEKRSYSICERK